MRQSRAPESNDGSIKVTITVWCARELEPCFLLEFRLDFMTFNPLAYTSQVRTKEFIRSKKPCSDCIVCND